MRPNKSFIHSFIHLFIQRISCCLKTKQKDIIIKSAEIAEKDVRDNVAKIEQEAYDLAKSKGMKIVTPSKADIDAFKSASKPVYEDYKKNAGSLGAQLLDVLHRSGKAMDLAPHINSDPHWNNVYPENALQSAMTDGVLSALPYELFVTPVTYNKKILKGLSLNVNEGFCAEDVWFPLEV